MTTCSGRMLVVDDEEAVRALCAKTIARLGIIVETAGTAEEAWRLLNARGYDCILSDISMPGAMDGAALTQEVKDRFPATDVLIMTGDPDLTTAVSTLKRGALDYLIKPFTLSSLESAVIRCFERRRLSEELNNERTLRRELEAAYAELQKVERAKDAFVSILNHELRTPLAIAIAAADMLEESSSPEETRKIARTLRAGLARENEVIEDLLSFSRLEAADLRMNPGEVDLEKMIRSLVENYRSVWTEKKLDVRMTFDSPMPTVQGDGALLQTAFKHLLLNAVRFNKKEGRVRIAAKAAAGRLEVLFSDTGVGIAPERQAQAFDRFYQIAEHMTREVGGLGLGLAIVRRIAEAHGGSVTVQSRPGDGSDFLVSLPIGAAKHG